IAVGSAPPDISLLHGATLDVVAADNATDELSRAAVIGGGVLGTGAQGPPRGRTRDWIGRVNDAQAPVLALDLPSGVDAATGRVAAVTVDAAVTVTFGWPKLGLLLHPARKHCGRIVAVEIGFPEQTARWDTALITPEFVRQHL